MWWIKLLCIVNTRINGCIRVCNILINLVWNVLGFFFTFIHITKSFLIHACTSGIPFKKAPSRCVTMPMQCDGCKGTPHSLQTRSRSFFMSNLNLFEAPTRLLLCRLRRQTVYTRSLKIFVENNCV